MLEFKDIELIDKIWVDRLLSYSDYRSCEYSFGNNFIWKDIYNIRISRYKDFYLLKSNKGFFFPAGKGNFCDIINIIKEYCVSAGEEFRFITMNKSSMEWLCSNYGKVFEVETNRDLYDYIYTTEALATLKGKKLHSKRNHINRFKESNWSYEPITEENIEDCIAMSKTWCELNENLDESGHDNDTCAVNSGFEHFFELGFKGGLLRVDGSVVAFTFGEQLNSDTFVVHVEKALTDIQGTYTAINYEFVNHECRDYTYINREEDLGLENLRKAKLSYKPVFLEEKFSAVFRG